MRRRRSDVGSRRMSAETAFVLLGAVVVLCLPRTTVAAVERPHYRTAYACEGSQLYISCDDGQIIHLIRANYGRFSITICNEHGNTDWSVNCIAPRSYRVLQERCDQHSSCFLNISSSLFGDPCPGNFKYVEVQYRCTLASTTTASTPARFAPPWLLPTTQPAWVTLVTRPNIPGEGNGNGAAAGGEVATTSATSSTSTTTTAATAVVAAATSDEPGVVVTSQVAVATVTNITTAVPPPSPQQPPPSLLPPVAPKPTTNASLLPATLPPVTVPPTSGGATVRWEYKESYCSPAQVRDLYWNWTKQGETAVISCPSGTTGFARWRCGHGPTRWMDNPDLSECRSASVTRLADDVEKKNPLVSNAQELREVTKSNRLYGGDILEAATILKKMAHKMSERVKVTAVAHREDLVKELVQAVVETGSNLLSSEQRYLWNDLSRQAQMKSATALLLGLEENAYLLADQVNYEKVTVQSDRNILMSIKVLRMQNVRDLNFPEKEDMPNSVWDLGGSGDIGDTISLPSEVLMDRAVNGLVKVVFFSYNNLNDLLQPAATSGWQGASGGNGTHNKLLNSKVISASFGRKHHIPLRHPVFVILRHTQQENVTNPTCVYWDYSRNVWSPSGCEVFSTNRSHTVCVCNHLTNFAVLMDVKGTQLSRGHEMALQLITYIGCVVSIACLALAFLTFSCFSGLNSDRNTIHKNLCGCLLIAEVLFLAGISQTSRPILCGVVAGFLHFFFLCSFAWMFFEGFQLYVMLIEVFESEKSRVRWYYILAYGLSALIVAISCVVDPFSYGTDKHCWLRADNYFIFSFVAPVAAVLMANVVFLSIAIFMMCRHANVTAAMKKKEQSRLANLRWEEAEALLHDRSRRHLAWIRGALVLVFLLGLTWTFGLLYLNEETVIMAYAFTVLNSLQGLFIFVFHCLHNEKVQKEYRKLIRRSPCLPECVREAAAKERRSSFYINSNCTASVPNSSSTPGATAHQQHPLQQQQLQQLQQQQSYLKRLWGNGKNRSPPTSSVNGVPTKAPLPPGHHPTVPEPEAEGMSFKSSNRDSGHGGSEPEESLVTSGSLRYNNNVVSSNNNKRSNVDYGSSVVPASDISVMDACPVAVDSSECNSSDYFREKANNESVDRSRRSLRPSHHHNHHHHHHHVRLSPLNHIYMDIESREGEPVYEEIDRSEVQVSDYSDEDGRRRSDISRQSSGSYGDNRPLLVGGQGGAGATAGSSLSSHHRGSERHRPGQIPVEGPPYHQGQLPPHPQPIVPQQEQPHGNGYLCQQQVPGENNPVFVAMLDGRKVVCRLQGSGGKEQPSHHHHHHHHHPQPVAAPVPPPPPQFPPHYYSHHYPPTAIVPHQHHRLSHSEC